MKDYTDITVILDRSGSMGSVKDSMEEVLNGYVLNQKQQQGETRFTLVQFDDKYDVVVNNADINVVGELKLEPRGGTALYDAIGKTITEMGRRYASMDERERPNKVIVVIVTDGHENASREYSDSRKLFDMVSHQQEKYNWQFMFLGANQDAIASAGAIGINKMSSYNFSSNTRGVKGAGMALCSMSNTYRSTNDWKCAEEKTSGGILLPDDTQTVDEDVAVEWDRMLKHARQTEADKKKSVN